MSTVGAEDRVRGVLAEIGARPDDARSRALKLEVREMPFYLKEADILPQVAGLRSVLIVPCWFCPAASLAVRERATYITFFRRLLRTEAYSRFIEGVKRRLEEEGIRTAVFDSKLPHHYVACMWTTQRRQKLARRAAAFDGVVVLGCDATTEAVRKALESVDCRIIQGMDMEGVMNILPRVTFPFNVSIELQGITPVTTSRPARDARARARGESRSPAGT